MPARPPRRAFSFVRLALLAGVLVAVALLGTKSASHSSADAEGGFVSDIVQSGLPSPVDLAFAPDGRTFIASKNGSVYVIDGGVVQPAPFITLSVNTFWDRGLQSIALDPDFATNHYVYLYYTVENSPDVPGGPKVNQLLRVTASGNAAQPGSELVLLGNSVGDADHPSCEDHPVDCLPADSWSHIGGGLGFASDGTLLLSTGDASFYPFTDEEHLSRTQDLDSFAGKVLRINPADGSAPADNPFYTGDPEANRSKVWAYGFRNPFRLAVDPATGQVLVGDVGSEYWEEVDDIQRGANYGWPCYEGTAQHPTQKTYATCQAMYASEAVTQHPLYTYQHGFAATLVGGVFARSASYPADMQGAYIYGDWFRNTVTYLPADQTSDTQLMPFPSAGAPTAFETGPDGDVYYVEWNGMAANGTLRHIRFVEGNRTPVAKASVWPPGGYTPVRGYFDSAGSFDPDGDELSYLWDFGDGATSTAEAPSHMFSSNASYVVRLTVTDEDGAQGTTTVPFLAGDAPPVATILTPTPSSAYAGGVSMSFSGSGTDRAGLAIPPSKLKWTVLLHHCLGATSSCHTHPYIDAEGASGTLVTPIEGEDSFYLELRLTATDSAGVQGTDIEFIGPDADADGLPDTHELLTSHTEPGVRDTDGDGCPDGRELGPNENLGGRRDPLNPWDYFNPGGDGVNTIADLGLLLHTYARGTGDPGYQPRFDRVYVGPLPWNLGPPDGKITMADILLMIFQYRHNCS